MLVLFATILADLCSVGSSSCRSYKVQGCPHRCLYKVGVKRTVRRWPAAGRDRVQAEVTGRSSRHRSRRQAAVCACVSVCVQVHACAVMCVSMYTYARMHARTHARMHAHTHTRKNVHVKGVRCLPLHMTVLVQQSSNSMDIYWRHT